jgi:hypothetical protein
MVPNIQYGDQTSVALAHHPYPQHHPDASPLPSVTTLIIKYERFDESRFPRLYGGLREVHGDTRNGYRRRLVARRVSSSAAS